MYELYGFTKKKKLNFADMLNAKNCVNPIGNCVHQMYRLSGFAENLNIQNYIN